MNSVAHISPWCSLWRRLSVHSDWCLLSDRPSIRCEASAPIPLYTNPRQAERPRRFPSQLPACNGACLQKEDVHTHIADTEHRISSVPLKEAVDLQVEWSVSACMVCVADEVRFPLPIWLLSFRSCFGTHPLGGLGCLGCQIDSHPSLRSHLKPVFPVDPVLLLATPAFARTPMPLLRPPSWL